MKRTLLSALLISTALVFWQGESALADADNRDVVRDKHGQIIHNTFGNCVRTKWMMASDACGPQPVAQKKRKRVVIAQEERTVYFGFDVATLSPDGKQRLNSLAKVLKSEEDVKEARIVGFADRIGTTSYNEKLSKKRAETVKKHLVNQGFVKSRVAETRWVGESVPKTNCPDNLSRLELIDCLQKDRRVEVEIDYLPENPPPAAQQYPAPRQR